MQQLQCVALNYSPPPLSLTPVLLSLLILYCILSFLLFSLFVSVLFMQYLHFFFFFLPLVLTPSSVAVFFFYPALPPLTLLLFLNPLTHPPPFLLSVSPLLSLSLSSTVSPEASLSHHSSSFINTCTHTAQHAQLPHISVHCPHKHTYTHPRARALPTAHMSPEDARSPVCPHTHTRLLCRKMPFVKGQGASISQLRQPTL